MHAVYAGLPHGRLGFSLGRYDHRHSLTIDPVLSYAGYLGGNGADFGIAVDAREQ